MAAGAAGQNATSAPEVPWAQLGREARHDDAVASEWLARKKKYAGCSLDVTTSQKMRCALRNRRVPWEWPTRTPVYPL